MSVFNTLHENISEPGQKKKVNIKLLTPYVLLAKFNHLIRVIRHVLNSNYYLLLFSSVFLYVRPAHLRTITVYLHDWFINQWSTLIGSHLKQCSDWSKLWERKESGVRWLVELWEPEELSLVATSSFTQTFSVGSLHSLYQTYMFRIMTTYVANNYCDWAFFFARCRFAMILFDSYNAN